MAWEAHIGGLAAGMAVTAAWRRIPPGPGAGPQRALVVYGLGLLLLLAILAA